MQGKKTLLGILTLALLFASLSSITPKVHAAADVAVAYYSYANIGSNFGIWADHPSATTARSARAQNFQPDQSYYLTEIRMHMKKLGSPTGNITMYVCEPASQSASALPTGTTLATSTTILDVSTLTSVYAEVTFEFNQTYQFTASNYYSFVWVWEDYSFADISNMPHAGGDDSSPTYSGGYHFSYYSSAWNSHSTNDLCFYVYANQDVYTPTSTPEPAWWDDENLATFGNLIVMFVIVLIPSGILGKLFKLGFYGYTIGLALGAGIGYVFYPGIIPLWLVFAVIIGITGVIIFGRPKGG